MRFRLHPGWTLTAILVAALVVRLAAGVWWQQRLPAGKNFAFGDSEGYWELGRTIARGQPCRISGASVATRCEPSVAT